MMDLITMDLLAGNILVSEGDLDGIYAAIDTYDMAKVVRAAMEVLKIVFSKRNEASEVKSKLRSAICRQQGNDNYKAGRHRQAIELYNKALAFAPKFSEEMILAYGNRSAVFFNIKYFSACVSDANRCLTMGCSEDLAKKLRKRRDEAGFLMANEFAVHVITSTVFVDSFLRFECKRNADVPCASADVAFVTRDGTKRATAGRDIKPGTVVAIERAYVSCPVENIFLTCYYCNKPELCLYPCEGCCRALFCTNECAAQCLKEYHCIECQMLEHLGTMYNSQERWVLATRAAIKLSLKMVWNDFINASKNIGVARMKSATVRQTFNPDEPLSILSYDDKRQFLEGRMFNGSIACACFLHCLGRVHTNYFPKDKALREEAFDAMARIMLHLYVTFDNTIIIQSSAYNFESCNFKSGCQLNVGWFSMSSKLKQSCEPNLYVLGLNSSIALVALRTIKRGEELNISYNGPHYDGAIQRSNGPRAVQLYLQTRQICESTNCSVCSHEWDRESPSEVPMTTAQAKLFAKVISLPRIMDYKFFYSMCQALDAFPINSVQHMRAYEAVRMMLNPIQSKYFKNSTVF